MFFEALEMVTQPLPWAACSKILRNFRALTEHLLILVLRQFAGEQVSCSHAGAKVSQTWF